MKHTLIILLSLSFIGLSTAYSQVKVGDNPTTIHSSAALEVESSNKGFLPPRMTTTERDAIPTPPAGLLIYNTTTKSLEFSDGTNWIRLSNGLNSGAVGSGTAPTPVGLAIGTTTPHGNAMLDVVSTEKGFLPPRLSIDERNAITNPAEGLTLYNTNLNCLEVFDGSIWKSICCWSYNNQTAVVDVINSVTGKTWMDRNLGAFRVAVSATDDAAYGDLYQWGRSADGHQCRNSIDTSTLSSGDVPGHGDFIVTNSSTNNWRSSSNDNLWQGVNVINNPCPSGYRLPTETEWNDEISSWGSNNNAVGAFASPLKLTMGGHRTFGGDFSEVGSRGRYWSSTVNSNNTLALSFSSSGSASMASYFRARGFSVRCIKD